jgi:two-component system, OmpR family, response regulator
MKTPRILIIDADPAVRNALSRLLRREGMEVSTAVSGSRALNRLRAGERFDCMIVDLVLPGMPGRVFLESLEDEALFAAGRIIILTAVHNVDNATAYMQRGCAAYCGKPYDNRRILAQVQRLCGLASEDGDLGAIF